MESTQDTSKDKRGLAKDDAESPAAPAKKPQPPLLAAYLVVGEDTLKKQAVLARLKARFAQEGDMAFNYDCFSGEGSLGSDIVNACNLMPFASNLRLIQVNDADKLKKADADALTDYLAKPNPSTVLALVAEKLAKNTRLYKAVAAFGAKAVIECAPQKRSELVRSLRSMAASYRLALAEGAAEALLDRVGEDTVRLDSELRKLALAHQGTEALSAHEVAALVAQSFEPKPWEFVDAFSARSVEKALRCRRRLESSSPHALLAMCVTRIRELICAKSLAERGCGHLLASSLKMPDWRVKNHSAWARAYTQGELRHALISARDAERAMKGGSDPEEAFILWALAVMVRHP
ncbi:MAG: DNA polymerase III subunit delta [Coriobacteriaceae bacterium]|jgi:DNA polymerase-3 subunit delta|nr:DNA polymerase III subunit delta [Coriobacteriaceae bacterium]